MARARVRVNQIKDADLLMDVYDEIVLECDASDADRVMKEVEAAMKPRPGDPECDWPIKAEANVSTRYRKW